MLLIREADRLYALFGKRTSFNFSLIMRLPSTHETLGGRLFSIASPHVTFLRLLPGSLFQTDDCLHCGASLSSPVCTSLSARSFFDLDFFCSSLLRTGRDPDTKLNRLWKHSSSKLVTVVNSKLSTTPIQLLFQDC